MVILSVLLGGLGAGVRYSLGGVVQRRSGGRFPVGTMAVNLLGAFAAGLVAGVAGPGTAARILSLGFLGGFTTFSTWSVETLTLARERRPRWASLNLAVMLLGGVLACMTGFTLTD